MSPQQIKIGCTYVNRGAGRTMRKVTDIGPHVPSPGYSDAKPGDVMVQFVQQGKTRTLSLKSFAQWAGGQI